MFLSREIKIITIIRILFTINKLDYKRLAATMAPTAAATERPALLPLFAMTGAVELLAPARAGPLELEEEGAAAAPLEPGHTVTVDVEKV